MRPLLLGGTDLTLAVAQFMRDIGVPPVGVVCVEKRFPISYSESGVTNFRYADLAGWCAVNGTPKICSTAPDEIGVFVREIEADFLLGAGWYHKIPEKLRQQFANGTAGLHASLLPRLRGGAPLSWAILSGADMTGVSLFALSDGIDDGPLYDQRTIPIGSRTTISDLVREAEAAALELISECLPAIAEGRLTPTPQQGEPSYCLQRVPDDGQIDWQQPAVIIDRLIRAVSRPYPGAFSVFEGERLFIWGAEPCADRPAVWGVPGQIFCLPGGSGPSVVTGAGRLLLREATNTDGESVLGKLLKANNRRFET